MANINAFISVPLGIYSFFYSCEKGNLITNDECLMIPSKFHAYCMAYFSSYFIYDFFVCLFLIREHSAIMMQTYLHHIASFVGTGGTLIAGSFSLPITVASMVTEMSTPALNYRSVLITSRQTENFLFKAN